MKVELERIYLLLLPLMKEEDEHFHSSMRHMLSSILIPRTFLVCFQESLLLFYYLNTLCAL